MTGGLKRHSWGNCYDTYHAICYDLDLVLVDDPSAWQILTDVRQSFCPSPCRFCCFKAWHGWYMLHCFAIVRIFSFLACYNDLFKQSSLGRKADTPFVGRAIRSKKIPTSCLAVCGSTSTDSPPAPHLAPACSGPLQTSRARCTCQ